MFTNRFCLMVVLFAPASIHADEPGKPEKSVQDIAADWVFKGEAKGKEGGAMSYSMTPPGSTKLHAIAGRTTYGSYADAWNFYAAKCGIERKYKPKTIVVEGKKTQRGEYILIDQRPDAALFVFRTEQYTVSVTIREGNDKEVLLTVMISLK